MKKAGQLYLLLVPLIEAFALPITVERATQKPTPNVLNMPSSPEYNRTWATNIHPNRHLSLPCSLAVIWNLRSSYEPKTKR